MCEFAAFAQVTAFACFPVLHFWRTQTAPGKLEQQVGALVDDYNNLRYYESLGDLTLADNTTAGARRS